MANGFKAGDRVLYDPRWKTGRRLYATVTESAKYGGYTIIAKVSPLVLGNGARIVGVRSDQLRWLSAVERLAEVVG